MRHRQYLVYLLLAFIALNANAQDDSKDSQTNWFHSRTSALLNKSTVVLSAGHASRGAFYARKVLEQQLSDSDRFIALHNLCLASLDLGKQDASKRYCSRAIRQICTCFSVHYERGVYYLVEETGDGEGVNLSLVTLFLDNIYRHHDSALVSLEDSSTIEQWNGSNCVKNWFNCFLSVYSLSIGIGRGRGCCYRGMESPVGEYPPT